MTLEAIDQDWRKRANCKGSDIDLFYPEDDISFDKALEICKDCPVIEQCRNYGLRNERYGVHGGLTPKQKNKERKRLNITINTSIVDSFIKSAPPHMSCGTNAGYAYLIKRYRNNPEWEKVPCLPCNKAHADYVKAGRNDPVKREKIISYQRAYEQRIKQDEKLFSDWQVRRRATYKKRYDTLKAKKQEQRLLG